MKYYTITNGENDLNKSKSTTITADSLEDAERLAKSIYKSEKATASFQEEYFDEDDYL